jgi:hypothetical protein
MSIPYVAVQARDTVMLIKFGSQGASESFLI